MNKLCIVIPAFKSDFLKSTLQSFANQTNKKFTIYVGDDASPYNIKEIVEEFTDKLTIVYHRFEDNLGGKSLTKQWERCVQMSTEEWIWLFSDDDLVSPDTVQKFYESVNNQSLLYKFNTKVINEYGKVNKYFERFDNLNNQSNYLESNQFINKRLECKGFRSYAVEYIFHRSLFNHIKFVDFPLAWSSDDATWLLYSLNNNRQITILNSDVFWRFSGVNISSDHKNIKTISAKIEASSQYLTWLRKIDKSYNLKIIDRLYYKWLLIQLISLNTKFSLEDLRKIFKKSNLNYNIIILSRFKIKLFIYRIYKKIRYE